MHQRRPWWHTKGRYLRDARSDDHLAEDAVDVRRVGCGAGGRPASDEDGAQQCAGASQRADRMTSGSCSAARRRHRRHRLYRLHRVHRLHRRCHPATKLTRVSPTSHLSRAQRYVWKRFQVTTD